MEHIKGQCGECGFAFEGKLKLIDGGIHFPELHCPKCGKMTENFDEAADVDERNEEEETSMEFVKVRFTTDMATGVATGRIITK